MKPLMLTHALALSLALAATATAQQAPRNPGKTLAPKLDPTKLKLPPGQIRKLEQPTRLARGGSNNGGGNRGSQAVAETLAWCRGSLGLLAEARSEAILAALDDELAQGYRLLQDGMLRALERARGEDAYSSITWRALSRGIELAQLIDALADELDPRHETRLTFLLRYYEFLERTALQLDLPHYVPWTGGKVDERLFETRFVEYAHEQLAWLLETFTTPSAVYGATPKLLSTRSYLGALEFVVAYTIDDLSESLWSAKHACAIEELTLIGEKLAAHNADNAAYYRDDRRAVNLTHTQLSRISRGLKHGCGSASTAR
jgi:hypothetical protein